MPVECHDLFSMSDEYRLQYLLVEKVFILCQTLMNAEGHFLTDVLKAQ